MYLEIIHFLEWPTIKGHYFQYNAVIDLTDIFYDVIVFVDSFENHFQRLSEIQY